MNRKILLAGLGVLFLSMALYDGYDLYQRRLESRAVEQTYEALTQYVRLPDAPIPTEHSAENRLPEETGTTEPISEAVPDDPNWPVVDFESLQMINPDVVAWIFLEGTNINYPVVQGEDNVYYLQYMFNGDQNSAGSIFLDYRNPGNWTGRNSVLYGHNMKNGTMFRHIIQYKDQAFYDRHPTALLMTPEKNYRIEFVAGYVTHMNSDAWKLEFESDEEFSRWLENAMAQSTFSATVEAAPSDRVITLSTCSYEYRDARYVLIGILK